MHREPSQGSWPLDGAEAGTCLPELWLSICFILSLSPHFSYLSFTVYLLYPPLLCPPCPHFFLCPLSVYLNPSDTNIKKMSWLWYNNCCHCAWLSFIILHLPSVSLIQIAHSLKWDATSYLCSMEQHGVQSPLVLALL